MGSHLFFQLQIKELLDKEFYVYFADKYLTSSNQSFNDYMRWGWMIVFKGLEYSFFVRYLRSSIEIFVLKFKLWITTKKYILYKCGWLRLCLDSSVIFVVRKSLKAIQMTNTKIRKIGRPITKVLCQDLRLFHRSFHDNSMTQWAKLLWSRICEIFIS